ncbi:MAG: tetratricopeptide repeat protein, partial [Parachlamydia sp.]|nr:tetratricopeptide repeat protein [Parachlamydia sp.]
HWETAIKILDQGCESPVIRGFSYDDGGNTPLGKTGYVELIQTPIKMASFQTERFYQEDLILSNILRGGAVIFGSELLGRQYHQAAQAILTVKSRGSLLTLSQERALDLLKGHLAEFEPRLDKRKEEIPIYNIKFELYRLPNFLIAGLADYFGIEEQNTWKRLEMLAEAKILSEEGAQNIKVAMNAIMHLRIRSHIHYCKECDEAYHPSMEQKGMGSKLQSLFVLTDPDIQQIMEIYRVILPLHRKVKEACKTRHFDALVQESFYDKSLMTQGQAYAKLHRYAEATSCYQQAVAMNPDDADALIRLADVFRTTTAYASAKEYAEKALELGRRKKDAEVIFESLNIHGNICAELGEHKKAISYLEQALDQEPSESTIHSSASIRGNLGFAWHQVGELSKAIECYQEALQLIQGLGEAHSDMAHHLNNLGGALKDAGRVSEAIEYLETALDKALASVGEEHLLTASILTNLGLACLNCENPQKALAYFNNALKINKKIFGDEHPQTAICLNNYGLALKHLGFAKEAIEYYNEALRIDQSVFGEQHPNVANRLSNLGAAYLALGNLENAIYYNNQALKITRTVLGETHPSVATLLNNLGDVYMELGDREKAIHHYEQTLVIDKKVYGNEHPNVMLSLNKLGLIYLNSKDAKKAIGYFEEAARISTKVHGEKHTKTAIFLRNLQTARQASGEAADYVEEANDVDENAVLMDSALMSAETLAKVARDGQRAVSSYQALLRLSKQAHGEEHPNVVASLNNLGTALMAAGDSQKAIVCFEEALKISKKVYGDEHCSVAQILWNLGRGWQTLGNMKKAKVYFEAALTMSQKLYGHEHVKITAILNELGSVWLELKNPLRAKTCFEEALSIDKKQHGDEHPNIATRLNNLGNVWLALEEVDNALIYFEEALKIDRKVHGEQHANVAIRLSMIGNALGTSGNAEKAISYFKKALKIDKQFYGEQHPEVAVDLNNLGNAWLAIGDVEKAIICHHEAYEIDKKAYGDQHPKVAMRLKHLHIALQRRKDLLSQAENSEEYVILSHELSGRDYGTEKTLQSETENEKSDCSCTLS